MVGLWEGLTEKKCEVFKVTTKAFWYHIPYLSSAFEKTLAAAGPCTTKPDGNYPVSHYAYMDDAIAFKYMEMQFSFLFIDLPHPHEELSI